ncbi:MAG: glycyl-radical enzyme activating protein [Ruminococcaceae bacterium]|nr:glycyl-radical enzyme activating protein [Oscillospiraceae bacterium]
MSVKATVTNISRCSMHDGPGIRTVVYLKGCGLRCKWCHNPETFEKSPQIAYIPDKCIKCGRCIEICPLCHVIDGDSMAFLRDKCTSCGKCALLCPTKALTLIGEEKSSDDIFEEIKKDSEYYKMSGGGVTFSGGECLLYPDFVAEVADKCKKAGFSAAVESALFVKWENVEKVIPYIDLFMTDLKIADSKKHSEYTGQPNDVIVENLKKLSQTGKKILVRIPIIPSVNDTQDDFEAFANVLNSLEKSNLSVELLKYNYLASSKYGMLGKEYIAFSDKSQSDAEMKAFCTLISEKTRLNCTF